MNRSGGKETGAGVCLHIKNMVCDRCVMAVRELFASLDIKVSSVTLGCAVLAEPVDEATFGRIKERLVALGFELIDDKRLMLAEQIKNEIIRIVHHGNGLLNENLSEHLQRACNYEYSTLSKVFSDVTGMTVEKYFIAQKIEKVKELLDYDELSLNQIADRLCYSSAAHLSGQFKSVTGMTPTEYKKLKVKSRTPIDKI